MQSTELDPTLAETLSAAEGRGWKLIIANKNYSSWSMRPWVVMRAFGIPFSEVLVPLGQPETGDEIAKYSAAGRLPVLLAGEVTVWDSLAICEFLAEQFPEKQLWPTNEVARAMARSICAEMHSGFGDLRLAMWMNIRARFSGKGRTPGAQADIGRISEIWETCLAESGYRDYLFGKFSIADAYFAPVVMRFRTYNVSLTPVLQAYCDRIIDHPAVAQWMQDAMEERHVLPSYDVYPD